MKSKISTVLSILCHLILFLFVFLGILLVFTGKWLLKTWGLLTIDEVVYHLKSSLDGTNTDMVKDYITGYGIWAFLTAAIVFIVFVIIAQKISKLKIVSYILLIAIGICGIGYAYHDIDSAMGVTSYVKQELFPDATEDFIADRYVDASSVDITFPEKKRNLIYIFMESMETTYSDTKNGGAFSENVIPELTALSEENENFSSDETLLNGGISLPGSTWTMGAMFAQSSGIPLKIPLASNQLENQDGFFAGITTLGDVLENEGYNQTLLLGSKATFGGRKIYYTQHGNYKIRDYTYAIANHDIPSDYYEFWGYEDEKLYEYAKDELADLSSKEEPFNLTMLTVDTHFEDGYLCDLCEDEFGDNQYANVMACASRQLTDFITWVQQQDFYEDTTIVISGDHPTMDTDFCNEVPSDYQRTTYTCIINADATRADDSTTRVFSTMDLYPTTLAAMGCTIEGNQLGLGVNLYSDKETLIEEFGLSTVKNKLSQTSPFINQLSGLSLTQDLIEQAKEKMQVRSSDENGYVKFTVTKLFKRINISSVDKLEIRATYTDPNSGEEVQKTYECNVALKKENDPNVWNGTVVTEIPYDQLQTLQASVYIWAGDFEEYYLGDYDYDYEQAGFQ